MNKPIGIFILAALLLCANASFIEHLYNNTHLKGDVKVNTDDGLKVGYNGNLYFDNGFLGFEIANLGGKFNAALRPGGTFGNQTNGTVDYSGEIQVSGGNRKANITVNGTAGLNAEFEKEATENGGNMTYNTTLTNENQWTVNVGDETAEGTTEAFLNILGKAVRDGNEIYVKKKLRGGVAHEGTFDDTDFRVIKLGKLGIKQRVFVKNESESEGGILSDILPTVGYTGIAKGAKLTHVNVDDDTYTNLEKGGAKYGGVIWYDKNDNNDSYIRAVKHSKNADFIHGGKVIVNHRLHALYGGVGTANAIISGEGRLTTDAKNFTAGAIELGNSHYVGVAITNPREEDEKALEKQMGELQKNPGYGVDNVEYEDDQTSSVDHHRRRKVKAYVNTKWVAGKAVKAERNDDNTIDVKSHGGVAWDVVGQTSDSRRPFHDRGAKGFNTTFEIDPNTATIRNMLLRYGNNPKAIEEIKKRYSRDFRGFPQMR